MLISHFISEVLLFLSIFHLSVILPLLLPFTDEINYQSDLIQSTIISSHIC